MCVIGNIDMLFTVCSACQDNFVRGDSFIHVFFFPGH